MHEVNEKVKKICDLKDKLICQVTPYVDQGVFCEHVDGNGVGEAIDMIKDLCDAEKNLYKACYYKTVTEAMKKAEKEEMMLCEMGMTRGEDGRMGYDNWRYSSGRFAPKGSGHYAGYTPEMPHTGYPDFHDPVMGNIERTQKEMGLLGYPHRSMSTSRSGRYGYPKDDRYGDPYNDYTDAKRHYTESKDPVAKKEMEEHAEHHLMDTLQTTKDIWRDAKPEKQKEFKKNMMELLKDIPS